MATRRARAPAAAPLVAYVLHSYDWSESSLILELFTRERGRVAVIAKGAKRPTSQLRAILLPFQRVLVTLGRTPSDDADIHVLRQAEWGADGGPLMPPGALFHGFYLNELLLKLLARQDPHPALFDAYADTLPALACGEEALAQAGLRAFELCALREGGFLPDLGVSTLNHQPVLDGHRYALRPEVGVVATQEPAGSLDGTMLKALQQALDEGGHLADVQRACLPALSALRIQLRGLLHYHLGTATWRTREVLHSVQRLHEAAPPAAGPSPSTPT